MDSLGSYIKKRNVSLGKDIKDKKNIYLDTKYWVDFCNVSLNKNKNKKIREVYYYCKELVAENKAIFPISYRIFIELLKQNDQKTLFKTIEIIDSLSQGIAIISEEKRIDLELLYFFRDNVKRYDLHEPVELVWTKVVNVIGIMSPELTVLSHEENLQIKKLFFDYTWNISLYKMISTMGTEGIKDFLVKDEITTKLNKDKIKYCNQNNTLHQTYMSEISGIVDLYRKKINELLQYIVEPLSSKNKQNDTANKIANIIYYLFDKNKNGEFLPSWDIKARMHSLIRWDKNRKYKENDLNDIGHIITALPYFDYFFTERSFSSLIIQSKYDDKYNCKVIWKYEDALVELKELCGRKVKKTSGD